MQDIEKYVYAKGKGNLEDKSRFGSIYHTRGVVAGIITVEAIRIAQAQVRQGQADHRRADALGPRAPQPRREAR